MKITSITPQRQSPDKVNIFIDGRYRLSLYVSQVVQLGVAIGKEYSTSELAELETASDVGKLYVRAVEYVLVRPRSSKEIRDYLRRKTYARPVRHRRTGEVTMREGISQTIVDQVYELLQQKGYIDDEVFARFWIERRNVTKGSSRKKLMMELLQKGIPVALAERLLHESDRSDGDELRKVIEKKRRRYEDDRKFIVYLQRQGFRYDDIKAALSDEAEN